VHVNSEFVTPVCSLCHNPLKSPHKAKLLNGFPVCNSCRNGFANRRQFAYIIDTVLWNLLLVPVFPGIEYLIYGSTSFNSPNPFMMVSLKGEALELLLSLAFTFLFFMKDGFSGMSPGKRLMGVQVVDADTHEPIGFGRSFKRNLVLLVPFSVLIVAVSMMKGTRWGDGWARTKVIWRKYRHRPVFDPRGLFCTNCGYDLTGNVSGRCPECFTPSPPAGVSIPTAGPVDAAST
jgi:uncharacterized RDD family membrane protein YckC